MGLPIPEWFDPTQIRDGDGCCLGDLRPSEVVHQTIPDPAEQAPLVARSVTPPSPSGRGGTTLLRQRAPRSCTVFVMTPPNEHTSEGGRDDRGVPYHAESTLSSAQVLKAVAGRVISRYTRVLREISGILPIWPKIWLILGPNQPQTRLRAKKLTISTGK